MVSPYPGHLLLLGPTDWGVAYVLDMLGEHQHPPIWIQLGVDDAEDPIAQGNKLAEAVAKVLGGPLFGYGMPYAYGLNILRAHQDLLGPYRFVLIGAEHGLELAEALLAFQKPHQALLLLEDLPENWLPPQYVPIHRHKAPAAKPKDSFEGGLNAKTFIARLVQKNRWAQALEFAALHDPEQVGALIEPAGWYFWKRGDHRLLYKLLQRLPEDFANEPQVLRWKFAAAVELGQEQELLPAVKQVLEREEAPELRALYFEALFRVGNVATALHTIEQAVRAKKTTLILYQYGRSLQLKNLEESLVQLKLALRQAELANDLHWMAQISVGIAQSHIQLGQYHEAAYWADWGLKAYNQQQLGNNELRLSLLNELAFARMMVGDTTSLEDQLSPEGEYLRHVRPSLSRLFRSTLADLLIAEQRPREAVEIYSEIWSGLQRREVHNRYVDGYVRALLDAGEVQRAGYIAHSTVQLTADLPPVYSSQARLAYAVVQSLLDPQRGVPLLEQSIIEMEESQVVYQRTRAQLYLVRALLELGEQPRALALLSQLRPVLSSLGDTGLSFLAGPEEAFEEVFRQLRGKAQDLELWFLGEPRAKLHGSQIALRKRFAEILVALSLHPDGLSNEKLALAVYGEGGNPVTVKGELARLKEIIPLASKPYRLEVGVWADFIELPRLIMQNRIREAVRLYRGPLLAESEAKVVLEERDVLENALRQAALRSGDGDALLVLAQVLKDDLELWEAAIDALSEGDPRRIIAQAKATRAAMEA